MRVIAVCFQRYVTTSLGRLDYGWMDYGWSRDKPLPGGQLYLDGQFELDGSLGLPGEVLRVELVEDLSRPHERYVVVDRTLSTTHSGAEGFLGHRYERCHFDERLGFFLSRGSDERQSPGFNLRCRHANRLQGVQTMLTLPGHRYGLDFGVA